MRLSGMPIAAETCGPPGISMAAPGPGARMCMAAGLPLGKVAGSIRSSSAASAEPMPIEQTIRPIKIRAQRAARLRMRSLASGTGVGIRLMDFLDAARYVRRQRQRETRDTARELLEDRRADQRAGDEGAMHHIGDRLLCWIETVTAREIAIGLRRREDARIGVASETFEAREARLGRPATLEVFAGEHTQTERLIGDETHAFAMRDLGEANLEAAVQQVIRVLYAHDARQVELLCECEKLHDAPRRFFGDADVADLARAHQLAQCVQGLGDGHGVVVRVVLIAEMAEEVGLAVGPVQLIEVDVIGLQAFQAGVEGEAEVVGIETRIAVAYPGEFGAAACGLGREDHVLTAMALLEPAADVFLRSAVGLGPGRHRVHLGGVNEIDTRLEGIIELLVRLGLAVLLAEGHGTETHRAHLDVGVSQMTVFHGSSLYLPLA